MQLITTPDSTATITVDATGLLKSFAHQRDFVINIPVLQFELPDGDGPWELPIDVEFDKRTFRMDVADLSKGDEKILDRNLHGKSVLASKRFPRLRFSGHYKGDLTGGDLQGQLTVRDQPVALSLRVEISQQQGAGAYDVTAQWDGTLTKLGVKPFSAFLGAIRLKDRARIQLLLTATSDGI